MKRIYGLLCVLGLVLPYRFFVPFVMANGLNLPLFFRQSSANHISTFFVADVVVASLVLWTFIYQETRKRRIPLWWLPIVVNLVVGVSLALPLFLWLREPETEKGAGRSNAAR
jgi:hypothetical protein